MAAQEKRHEAKQMQELYAVTCRAGTGPARKGTTSIRIF